MGDGVERWGRVEEMVGLAASLEAERRPRWTWWAAGHDAAALVAARVWLGRCWDIAEVHRLLAGGWEAGPARAWAHVHGLDPARLPREAEDLFGLATDVLDSDPHSPVRADGYLQPGAGTTWAVDGPGLVAWGRAALTCAERQESLLRRHGPRAVATAHAESAAALLCVELARDGLPVDRPVAERLIGQAAGPRPRDLRDGQILRAQRDQAVLRHVPGRESTDLRNPHHVRDLLASVGVVVPSTRKGALEPFRETHPVVAALLQWRKAERIATTYGYEWLDRHVGPDGRLRGAWTACDGSAGRMTAQNGLHNLPTSLRPAVAAHPGHVLVRADLGQVEPRVLAAVSGDAGLAAAARGDDLYAPVAAALGVERAVAKVAVLGAMYGGRRGVAADALRGLERAYPTAMAYLDRAYAAGVRRATLHTFGGRAIVLGGPADSPGGPQTSAAAGGAWTGGDIAREDGARDAARGRYARNAVIQGAAAELFKAWAATTRATTRELGAEIVLCLHDELLVHVPEAHAEQTRDRLVTALDDSARRWTGSTRVRFVAETSIVRRWSEAKG